MKELNIGPIAAYDRVVKCMPDKSMSIRAVLFNAFAEGSATVRDLLLSDDVLSAVDCVRRLGAMVELDGTTAHITGARFTGCELDCGNSGTTARLLMGLLAGLDGVFTLTGDASLSSRPMMRVITPLQDMGAVIEHNSGKLPVKITGARLHGIRYEMPVASAQVKSAVLLAGINAKGVTTVVEPAPTRDHSENMLKAMGGNITVKKGEISSSASKIRTCDFTVPGDISSAAYPLCLALMIKGGRCTVKNVGINPTRTGLLDVLYAAGADISLSNERGGAEPIADITVRAGALKPFTVDGDIVPRLVDEIPALCALACFIDGVSVIKGARELRVKETDRIATTVAALRTLGADIEGTEDGMIVRGGKPLRFGTVDPKLDHRIAMTAAITGAAGSGVKILDPDCAAVSYPHFYGEVLGV